VASHLKHLCLVRGDRPIAGCDFENIASKKALEAAGFQTQHQLFEYSLQGKY
jgi:RimJ/RimL family protein N-acetyltransferase